MNIKEVYEKMKINLCIDKNIRDLFSEYLKLGTIIRIESHKKEKFSTCDPHLPSEYFSKENIIEEYGIVSDQNEHFVIREEYLGLNFEEPCDKYVLKIMDHNECVIADTSDLDNFLDAKRKNKQKRKGKRV